MNREERWVPRLVIASFLLFVTGCGRGGPISPFLPTPVLTPTLVATPTTVPTPAPVCGFRDLGSIRCSNLNSAYPYVVLRSAADWGAYSGAGTCAPIIGIDLSTFDFSAETVLIYQEQHCVSTPTCPAEIVDVCISATQVEVTSNHSCSEVPPYALPGCISHAVAIPSTSLPVVWAGCSRDMYTIPIPPPICSLVATIP